MASAEPNFLYRTSATPNDPGFAQRQWNFAALDMPRAWDINPGATDRCIVAVVDTGVTSVSRSYLFQTWNGRGDPERDHRPSASIPIVGRRSIV